MSYVHIPQQDRSDFVCALTILAVTPLLCLAAAAWCIWRLALTIWQAPLTRWLRREFTRTAQELYQDRYEMGAWLLVLAVLAFFTIIYPYQP